MKKIFIASVFILIISFNLSAQAPHYMNSPLTTGSYSIFYNPSFLGRTDIPWYSWEIWRDEIGVTNNLASFDLMEYIFENAANAPLGEFPVDTITDEKKQTILHKIGDFFYIGEYLNTNTLPLGLKFGPFAFALESSEHLYIQIPDAVFDLILYGNQFDSIYDFMDFKMEAQVLSRVAMGLGGGIDLESNGRINYGLSLSYILGLGYAEISPDSFYFDSDSSYMSIITRMNVKYAIPAETPIATKFDDFGTGFGDLAFSYAPPGNGFDITAGASWNINDQWMVEGSFEHLFSRIFWTNNARSYSFLLRADSLNVINVHRIIDYYTNVLSLEDSLAGDSIRKAILGDSFISGEARFTTILQPQVHVGASYTMQYMPLYLFGRYTQGFTNSANSSVIPQIEFGLQYTAWSSILLESMVTFGGREFFQYNAGVGFNFGNFTSDINVTQDKGLFYYMSGARVNIGDCSHSRIISVYKGIVVDSITGMPLEAKLTILRKPGKGIDSLYSDSLGKFIKYYSKSKVSVRITCDKYDTMLDTFTLKTNATVSKLYRMNPSMGTLLVKVISGITKKPIEQAKVIFMDNDTQLTNIEGVVTKRLDEGHHVVVVKSAGRDDVVFTIDIERGKDYSQLVEMFPTHGKLIMNTFNATTKEPVNSSIKIYTTDMKTLIDSFDTGADGIDTSKAVKKGFYNIKIDPLVAKYIKQDKFNVEIKGGLVTSLDVALLKEKMVFVFNNILFDYNKATLRPESYPVCDSLATIMKENPSIKVEIGGHTDSRGSSSYNKKLSQSRSESVRNYLISKHQISDKRITAKGYGEDVLMISPEKGEDDYQKNRRVEFKVLQGE